MLLVFDQAPLESLQVGIGHCRGGCEFWVGYSLLWHRLFIAMASVIHCYGVRPPFVVGISFVVPQLVVLVRECDLFEGAKLGLWYCGPACLASMAECPAGGVAIMIAALGACQ